MSLDMQQRILEIFNEVYKTQTESESVPKLTNETILLDTGLDSLGFAVLVVTLEQELGFDPFLLSEEAYYPQTFGEFLSFYEKNAPK